MDHEDVQEQIIMALLPHVLSTCRRITHNGRNLFIERCQQVLELRDLRSLVRQPETRHRRRLVGPNDDGRVRQDVLKLIRMSEYSRAGKALLRQEVARGTESTLAALDRLHPDGATALEALRGELQEEELPAPTPLDRGIFMHTIGADETGRVKRGSAADAAGWRWEHFAWGVNAGAAEDLYEFCNALWSGTLCIDWLHAGRLVSLRKPGDIDDQDDVERVGERNIRPIGLVSIFMRLIGSERPNNSRTCCAQCLTRRFGRATGCHSMQGSRLRVDCRRCSTVCWSCFPCTRTGECCSLTPLPPSKTAAGRSS